MTEVYLQWSPHHYYYYYYCFTILGKFVLVTSLVRRAFERRCEGTFQNSSDLWHCAIVVRWVITQHCFARSLFRVNDLQAQGQTHTAHSQKTTTSFVCRQLSSFSLKCCKYCVNLCVKNCIYFCHCAADQDDNNHDGLCWRVLDTKIHFGEFFWHLNNCNAWHIIRFYFTSAISFDLFSKFGVALNFLIHLEVV